MLKFIIMKFWLRFGNASSSCMPHAQSSIGATQALLACGAVLTSCSTVLHAFCSQLDHRDALLRKRLIMQQPAAHQCMRLAA
jgi:hypothetical protein